MNKKGQYYLIAAIIIVGLIITFATVTNSIQQRTERERLYNLYNSMNFDVVKTANFELYPLTGYTEEQMKILLYDLNNVYPGIKKDIYLITVPLKDYPEGHSFKYIPGPEPDYGIIEMSNIVRTTENGKIGIILNTKTYYLDYDPEKNNYFIIISENQGQGEQYIISGKG